MQRVRKAVEQPCLNGKVTGISFDGKCCTTKKYVNGRFVVDEKTDVLVVLTYPDEKFLCAINLEDKSAKAQAYALYKALVDLGNQSYKRLNYKTVEILMMRNN